MECFNERLENTAAKNEASVLPGKGAGQTVGETGQGYHRWTALSGGCAGVASVES